MLRFVVGFLLFALVVACGGSTEGGSASGEETRQALDVKAFCNRLIDECKDKSATHEECEKRFAPVRVSPKCVTGFATTACPDIVKPGGLCFPSCTGNAQTCNEDKTLTTCTSDGRRVVFDCASICTSLKTTFTGVCDVTYIAQTSEDGRPRCWCE